MDLGLEGEYEQRNGGRKVDHIQTVLRSLRGLKQQGWERLPDQFSSRNFAKHINILKVLRSPATKRSI